MNSIKIIPPVKLDVYAFTTEKPIKQKIIRRCFGIIAKQGLLMVPFFVLATGCGFVWMSLWYTVIAGCVLLCIGGAWMYTLFKGGTYKPEMSFAKWRPSKEAIAKRNKKYAIGLIITSILAIIFIGFKLAVILGLVCGFSTLYYMNISFKIHEDVDFSVNNKVAELLGFEIDEKIQCSYENDVENQMLVVTDRRLFFTYKEDDKQLLLIKKIDELSEIGIFTSQMMGNIMASEIGLVLRFTDATQIQLKMDMIDKMTSNPELFFKKFLVVLDDFILGRTSQRSSSRRRVSVSNETNDVSQEEIAVPVGRSIDISDSILETMKTAIPVSDNRNIEL